MYIFFFSEDNNDMINTNVGVFKELTSQVKSSRFFENTNWQYAVAYNIDTI